MLVLEWKERAFIEKVNSRCFCWFPAAILVHQNGIPIWRLHTKLYKGAWNVNANNSETVGHKVPNRSLSESFLKEERENMRFFFHVIIYWKTTIKDEVKDRIAASGNEIDREPETYRLSKNEEIVFAVVIYISPKDTDMELKLKSIQKQSYGNTIRGQIWRF